MICSEINPEGKYSTWDPVHVEELKENRISDALGHHLIFENDGMVLWSIVLKPGERLPFAKHNKYFSWVCRQGGMAISRNANGSIEMLKFEAGDAGINDRSEKTGYIRDLQNIGDNTLELKLIEFKKDQHTGQFIETH